MTMRIVRGFAGQTKIAQDSTEEEKNFKRIGKRSNRRRKKEGTLNESGLARGNGEMNTEGQITNCKKKITSGGGGEEIARENVTP